MDRAQAGRRGDRLPHLPEGDAARPGAGSATMSPSRSHRLFPSTIVARIGSRNRFHRSSLSLTQIRTPTSTVAMYWSTTELGTGALSMPRSGGQVRDAEGDQDIGDDQDRDRLPERVADGASRPAPHFCAARKPTMASSCAAVSREPKFGGMMPANCSYPGAIGLRGRGSLARISSVDRRDPMPSNGGPTSCPSAPSL